MTDEWSVKITDPINRVYRRDNYMEGCVVTRHGIVYVYSQGGTFEGIKDSPHSTFQFVYGGRLYSREVNKRYTDRGLVTVANRFAGDVIYG